MSARSTVRSAAGRSARGHVPAASKARWPTGWSDWFLRRNIRACVALPDEQAHRDVLARVVRRTLVCSAGIVVAASAIAAMGISLRLAWVALLSVAFVLGWRNLSGQCAQNSLTAITPLAQDPAGGRAAWYQAAAAYTCAGLFSSGVVGFAIATLGHDLGLSFGSRAMAQAVGAVALYTVLREAFNVRLPLPESKRQSNGRWARMGQPAAATLWGLDVGSFVTTWLTFAGAWWLVVVAAFCNEPLFAAALFGAHWLGRCALLWLGPSILPDARSAPIVPAAWARLRYAFQLLDAIAVVLGTIVLLGPVAQMGG